MANEEFTLKTVQTQTFKEGWGVYVIPTWVDEESDRIVDIYVEVVHIAKHLVTQSNGVWVLPNVDAHTLVPVENFRSLDDLAVDDSHDLRTRWFATKQEAKDHAKLVRDRWDNPNPWESFIVDDSNNIEWPDWIRNV